MALMFWLRELTLRDALVERGEDLAELADAEALVRSWGHWREAATAVLLGLYEAQGARETLEYRYLAGHASLFPATVDPWRELAERTDSLYGMATTLREGDAFEPVEVLRDHSTAGAEAIAERLVRMASVETYRAMDERDRARRGRQGLDGRNLVSRLQRQGDACSVSLLRVYAGAPAGTTPSCCNSVS